MALWNRWNYQHRLFFWLLFYSWLMVICFIAFQYHREKQFKAEELNLRLQALNESLLQRLDETGDARKAVLAVRSSLGNLRISIITPKGLVIYDNSLDSLPGTDHRDRQEIADALRDGSGYTLRRHSESTGGTYFYSATRGNGLIVRSAIPYTVSIQDLLDADYSFLWFMIGVTLVMSVWGYFATRRMGQHIARLNTFAENAERGERIFDIEAFPHDELGNISSHIVRLYARLQQAVADRDREHRAALREEREKIRIKKQLTNNINHELKTPVAAMQVCLETLLAHPDLSPEKREEFLRRCYAGNERLKNLLADVSLITRMDDGSAAISREPLDLSEIIRDVCAEFSPLAASRGFELICSVGACIPFEGNASLLSSIFRNLMDNALSYSGGNRIEIVQTALTPGSVSLTVADNGCGVAEAHLSHLFERFYRVDKGRSRQAGGTGLGLSIVNNAVRLHHGSISVANRPGGGLIFSIVFRLSPEKFTEP